MATFELRRGTFERDPSWRMNFYFFDVRSGATETTFAVGLSDQLRRRWGLSQRANADDIERRAAVGHLKGHLASIGLLPRQGVHHLLLTAGGAPDAREDRTVYQLPQSLPYRWKECRFQKRGEAGPVCTAARPGERVHGRTTQELCEHCGLPSTDILCDNLVNVETVGMETDQTGLVKRSMVAAQCNIASEEFSKPGRDPKLCVPGGLNCWLQTYQPAKGVLAGVALEGQPPAAEAAPPPGQAGTEFSIAEVIDHLNIVFDRRYRRSLIQIKHARSIQDLMGDCGTDDVLQHKLQVAASLLKDMNLKGLLTRDEAKGCQGPIDLLARLAARDFPGLADHHLRDLRNINKLAAAYPRHTKVENIERAHVELGLDYPVTDYAGAWAAVRQKFIQAFRQVTLHLG